MKIILEGLTQLKTKVLEINPAFIRHVNVGSLLTSWKISFRVRGEKNTDTPMMLDFCMRFPRCINELLKCVTGTSYMYFTSRVASYYWQPTLENVAISFSDLAKLPKPLSGCLLKKHLIELHQWWVLQYSKSIRKNTTRNHSTKDKPGTLPLNLYTLTPPEQHSVDFEDLVREDRPPPARHGTSLIHNLPLLLSHLNTDQALCKPVHCI